MGRYVGLGDHYLGGSENQTYIVVDDYSVGIQMNVVGGDIDVAATTFAIDGDLSVSGNNISFPNIPSDSTSVSSGELWFNSSTGALHRKF